MNSQTDLFPFIVPLTAANHQAAENFYQQHSNPQKAKQIYLNTLSVLAVNFYLNCLAIQTNIEHSHSWNPASQVLADIADLWVNDFGRLECRPMLADATVCEIPAQVWGDRIGYIIVQLNADLTEAALLGFAPQVETETLPLEKLQPIEQFPEYLDSLTAAPIPTVLSHWLKNQVAVGWQTLEDLLAWQQPVLSFRTPLLQLSERTVLGAQYGRFLTLGTSNVQVLFLVEIMLRTASAYQIRIELYPTGTETYLPRSLHLSVLDESGKPVLQAESSHSEGLEFQFAGEQGERFSIKISWSENSLIETFEI